MAGLMGAKDNSRRKYPDVGGSRHNPVGVLVRREEAKKRKEVSDLRTPQEQLARLDKFGWDAKRERARLNAKLKAPADNTEAKSKTTKAKRAA